MHPPALRARAAGVLVAAVACASCRAPTDITVVVTTDFPCGDLRHVDVMVGPLGDTLERTRPAATTSATCRDGYVGKVVVVPSGSGDDEVGIKVVAGFVTRDAEQCTPSAATPPDYGAGCIVERRALRYLPHTPLTVDMVLYAACDGVACNVTETCNRGACVPARIPDPAACTPAAGCTELPPASAGDAGPDASIDGGADAGIPTIAEACGDMSGLQAGAPWPMSGYCPTRMARSPYVAAAQTSKTKFTFPVTPSTDMAIAADGAIYYGGFGGNLVKVEPSGTHAWDFPTSTTDAVTGAPAIAADGTVYFGAFDGNLYAVTSAGKQKWAYPCAAQVSSPAVGGDGTVYFTSKDHVLHAIDPQGKKRWELDVGGSDLYAQPVLSVDGATIYVASFDGNLYAVSSGGAPSWHFDTPSGIARVPAVAPDGTIYFGAADGNLYAVTPAGKKRWAFALGASSTAPPAFAADGTIYATGDDGILHAIDPGGAPSWAYPTGRNVASGPTVGADGVIYLMASNGAGGGIQVVDPQGHAKWSFEDNVIVSPVIAQDGTLYAGDFAYGP